MDYLEIMKEVESELEEMGFSDADLWEEEELEEEECFEDLDCLDED